MGMNEIFDELKSEIYKLTFFHESGLVVNYEDLLEVFDRVENKYIVAKFDSLINEFMKKADGILAKSTTSMRDLTKEEREVYEKSLEKIYKPTGVNFYDLLAKEREEL